MSSSLENIVRELITYNGSLSVAAYWSLCLSYPQHGYYMNRDPLGVEGDFITAPEISQLFGEMIGIWVAERWHEIGQPEAFYLVECGPGRGTLMADILRVAKILPDFLKAMQIHLIEMSPSLRAKQGEAIKGHQLVWHDDISTLPNNAPIIFIGNEFLDALPIHQYIFQDGQWFERMVGLDVYKNLSWGLLTSGMDFGNSPEAGSMLEISPARENFMADIAAKIKAQGGAGLFIDYGHEQSGYGDTLQAVKDHHYADILKDCGEADITSHVDFGRLSEIVQTENLSVQLSAQGEFLKRLGIEIRAEQLAKKSDSISSGLHRLIDDAEMGTLFRAMEIK
jgi:NADH dehydrogenase [ubiquinone] 1 alpha subcomplex assembly factor 7